MKRNNKYLILGIFFIIISFCLIAGYYYIKPFYDFNLNNNIEILKEDNDLIVLSINTNDKYISCAYDSDKNNNISYTYTIDNKCMIETDKTIKNIYLKKFIFIRKIKLDNLIIKDDLPKKLYLALNDKITMNTYVELIASKTNIIYKAKDEDIVKVNSNKIKANKIGKTTVSMTVNDVYKKDFEIEVTDLITKRPKRFDDYKSNLSCRRYTEAEALKLDEILENKIENVGGYGTRAAVVESMRFLLLDFPYQVEYFFENGRLEGGQNKADGEGRYYHKGLYLSENKFENIKYTYSGPSIWGCPLMNWEDWGTTFKKGTYKPNGLDCSGFVTWTLLNGGFDVGDRGAGDNLEDITEVNDIGGEKVNTSVELFKSGKVKAGDLLGVWGHIAIIAGIDDKNVYVAESLWTYGGPVINTYSFAEATDEFVQTVLLDDFYKEDGLYTDMWY